MIFYEVMFGYDYNIFAKKCRKVTVLFFILRLKIVINMGKVEQRGYQK